MHDACGTQRCASCGLVLDWPALAACDDGASDFGANKVEGCAEVRDGDAALRRDGVEEKLVAEHPALELPLLPAREQRQVLPREQHHAAVEEQAVHAAERAKNGLAKHPELCGQSWLGFLRPASFLERSWINMAHCGQQEATALAWLGPMQLEYRTCSIGAHARARSYTLPARSSTVFQRDVLARLGPVLASSSSAFIWHAHMEEKAHVHV
mmetsp:Transcript_15898/g.33782  ORF Transcript_15898/g.33782 Transcript_15898/m.33782 type:complete len:211 (-) Transcript_15898:1443-2075(-)